MKRLLVSIEKQHRREAVVTLQLTALASQNGNVPVHSNTVKTDLIVVMVDRLMFFVRLLFVHLRGSLARRFQMRLLGVLRTHCAQGNQLVQLLVPALRAFWNGR